MAVNGEQSQVDVLLVVDWWMGVSCAGDLAKQVSMPRLRQIGRGRQVTHGRQGGKDPGKNDEKEGEGCARRMMAQ